jgi:hypothetical protein
MVAASRGVGGRGTAPPQGTLLLSTSGRTTITETPSFDAGTGSRRVTLATTLPAAGVSPWVFGSGGASTLVARVPENAAGVVEVWSTLTGDNVASVGKGCAPITKVWAFDLEAVAAVVGGHVCIAAFAPKSSTTGDAALWHRMCPAASVTAVAVEWPLVVALANDGAIVWVSNISAGVTETTCVPAPFNVLRGPTGAAASAAAVVVVGAASRHRSSAGTNKVAAASATVVAMRERRETGVAVGGLGLRGGVASWVCMHGASRNPVLRRVDLSRSTMHATCLCRDLPMFWPGAHPDKFPCLAEDPPHHCTTRWGGPGTPTTTHVLVWCIDTETLARTQLLLSQCGAWHKAHVLVPPAVAMEPTSERGVLGLVLSTGGYALLETAYDV